jgi:opacity protein-like surface antigen
MRRSLVLLAVMMAVPSQAAAEWTFAAFAGAVATRRNTLTVDLPARASQLTLRPVRYVGRSFESPPYYAYRVGRFIGPHFGIEAEFIHLKAYARLPVNPLVQRFSMSHGLNLVLGNLVWRSALSERVTVSARGGAGVAVPHGESTVAGISQEQYEISSAAFLAGGGVQVRVTKRVAGVVEYKLTATSPHVTVSGGSIAGRFLSHHVVVGVAISKKSRAAPARHG